MNVYYGKKGVSEGAGFFLKKVLHIAFLFSVLLCLKNENNLSPKFKISGAIRIIFAHSILLCS